MKSEVKNNSKPQSKSKSGKFTKRKGNSNRVNDRDRVSDSRRSDNDVRWYTANGQLLKDVSSFNFERPAGEPINLGSISERIDPMIPGILSIKTIPTVGISSSSIDPVNKAMQKIYSFVRHANSGHSNYDPADLMLYLLTMDSVYTYWSYLVRIYGALNVFSKDNLYIGNPLIKAMGVDPGELRANLADFRAYINMFAIRASTWAVPTTMTYYVRHSWMYSNIYKDEDTDRAQLYMYVPAGLYQFAVDETTGAGYLQFKPLTCGVSSGNLVDRTLGFSDLKAYGEQLLSAIEGVEDVGIMSGDVIKAYGMDNLWKLAQVPETYVTIPVFSEEVLYQFHNTHFTGNIPVYYTTEGYKTGVNDLDIKQNTDVGGGYLIYTPKFANILGKDRDVLLDFWVNDVTPEMSMVASRNMIVSRGEGPVVDAAGNTAYSVLACGSELVTHAVMYTLVGGEFTTATVYHRPAIGTNIQLFALGKFNEAPHAAMYTATGVYNGYFGELNNFAVLSSDNIQNLHTVALLSMFNVSNVG